MRPLTHLHTPLTNQDAELFQQDVWQVEILGFKPDTVHGNYQINFSRLKPDWFKIAVKQFVLFQSATKTLSSCISYVGRLIHFSDFISTMYPELLPQQVDRRIIVHYISYLNRSHFSLVTRNMALIHLRTFHSTMIQEGWLPWPKEAFIYSSDLPRNNEVIPNYIPEFVVSQLQQALHHLPIHLQHLITILLETGRRIGEICTLPLNCLEQDNEGDHFLKIKDTKLRKSYLIPISEVCLAAIKKQQQLVQNHTYQNTLYLFAALRKSKTPHLSARRVNQTLVDLAHHAHIVDENNAIWHFHSHQFRHTVGTRMINAGVSQTIVQKYLGHGSPTMTARYAHLHDETLKAAFQAYQGKLIDIHGKPQNRPPKGKHADAKWLQYHTMAQALPNGLCGLPSPQQRCPHANACLTCVHFRTHQQFLPQHQHQLEMTNNIIEASKANGWQRQVEMNLAVKKNLEKIIEQLQAET